MACLDHFSQTFDLAGSLGRITALVSAGSRQEQVNNVLGVYPAGSPADVARTSFLVPSFQPPCPRSMCHISHVNTPAPSAPARSPLPALSPARSAACSSSPYVTSSSCTREACAHVSSLARAVSRMLNPALTSQSTGPPAAAGYQAVMQHHRPQRRLPLQCRPASHRQHR